MLNFKKYILLSMMIVLSGCNTSENMKNNINVITNQGDLEFIFPASKQVMVYHYEINDYENFEDDGLMYKRLYVSDKIGEVMKKIIFKDYKDKNILDNHAYYLLVGEQEINKQGVGFTPQGFCLKNAKVLMAKKKENTVKFINKCRGLT